MERRVFWIYTLAILAAILALVFGGQRAHAAVAVPAVGNVVAPVKPYTTVGKPAAEGKKAAPLRPTIAQCAERISLQAGDVTYENLVTASPLFINVALARAIIQHPLCYGDLTKVIIIQRSDVDEIESGSAYYGDLFVAVTQRGVRKRVERTTWGITYASHPGVIRVLAMVAEPLTIPCPDGKGMCDGVNVNQPPAFYPATTTIYNKYFGYLLGEGFWGYFNWRRTSIAVTMPVANLNKGINTTATPMWEASGGLYLNPDVLFRVGACFPSGQLCSGLSLRAERPMARFMAGWVNVLKAAILAFKP